MPPSRRQPTGGCRPAGAAGYIVSDLSGAVRLKRRFDRERELWIAPKCALQRQWTRLWYYPPIASTQQASTNMHYYKASQPELLCCVHRYYMVLEFYEAAQFTYTRPKDHLPSSSPCNSFAFFFLFLSACPALFKLCVRERITILLNYLQLAVFLHSIEAQVTKWIERQQSSGDILGRNLFQIWEKTEILQGT